MEVNRMRKVWLCALPLALVASAVAVPEITQDDIRAHISYLASDELEGRLAVSRGFERAAAYAAAEFKKYGLEPKGTEGYFQPFQMTAGFRPGKNNFLTITVAGERYDFELGKDFMPVSTGRFNHWADGPLVFVGSGIRDDERDDFAGADLTGKIAVMRHGKGPLGNPSSIRDRVKTAQELGAKGVLLVSAEKRMPVPIIAGGAAEPGEGIPVVEVSVEALEQLDPALAAALGQDEGAPGMAPAFEIANSRARFISQVERNTGMTRNVVAFLPGNDPQLRDEIIVLGAHLDHLGFGQVGTMGRSREIHNGADDNASGSASVLEMAEYYAHYKTNRRSMLFVLFAGEEEGLIGSRYFVNNPTIDLSKVTAMVNFDMVGRLKDDKLVVEGTGSSPIWPELLDSVDKQGLTTRYSPGTGGGSDHSSFASKQVPVVFFFTNIHPDYHRPTDDWEAINYDGQVRVLEYARRVIDAIDARGEKVPWQQPSRTRGERRPPADDQQRPEGPRGDGPRVSVRIGLVPDYSFEGTGVMLSGTTPGTPAEKAGLRAGDIIVQWDDIPITDMDSLMKGFAAAKAGVAVRLVVQRGQERIEVTIVPEARGQP